MGAVSVALAILVPTYMYLLHVHVHSYGGRLIIFGRDEKEGEDDAESANGLKRALLNELVSAFILSVKTIRRVCTCGFVGARKTKRVYLSPDARVQPSSAEPPAPIHCGHDAHDELHIAVRLRRFRNDTDTY